MKFELAPYFYPPIYAYIDEDDFDRVNKYSWSLHKLRTTYVKTLIKVDGKYKAIYLHRFILNAPKGSLVDHIDGNGLNNQKSNLRLVTPSQSMQNRGTNKNNTSGYKGVVFFKLNKKWRAQIYLNKKHISLGYYSTPEEASKAYEESSKKLFGAYKRIAR